MRALRLELVRLLGWKRWLGTAAIIAVVAWVVGEDLVGTATHGRFGVNQWDLVLEIFNNYALILWILVPLFVGLVGDTLTSDRRTGFAFFSLPRVGSRARWWAAKLGAAAATSLAFFWLVVAVAVGIGIIMTGPGWELSEYGRATFDPFAGTTAQAAKYYAPPPVQSMPLLGVLVVASYTAVAVAALVSVFLAAAQIWPRPWTPLVLTVGVALVFWQIEPSTIFHPLIHLFWDSHTFSLSDLAVQWWASWSLIGLEFVVAFILGSAVLRRTDV